ncbi:MAG TPA: hypothetical protein VEA69_17180 [Tepidisphaeraceae bacterium]|nr:hypothetical protein [Tepidisphaeraceae bacterium]
MNRRTGACLAVLLTIGVTGGGLQAQPAPPAPAPVPVAPPAPAPPPGPKQVAVALAGAIDRGDAAAARGLVVAHGISPQVADATVALAGAVRRLETTAGAKFTGNGAAGAVVTRALRLTDGLRAVEQAQEQVDGDSATLTLPGAGAPVLRARRTDGAWRIDLTPAAPDDAAVAREARRLFKLYDLLAKAADQTAAEVNAGAHATSDEAAAAFAGRVLRARLMAE